MATLTVDRVTPRPRAVKLLLLFLLGQFFGIGGLLQYYAFFYQNDASSLIRINETLPFKLFAIAMLLLALTTMWAVWQMKGWAPWAVLTLVSFKITVDILNWSYQLDRLLIPLSEFVNGTIILLAFALPGVAATRYITRPYRIFYGAVLILAGYVGVAGFFLPQHVGAVLPWEVPPLHARFLGAMYFAGVTGMALSIAAREWAEVRVTTPMIAIWTGMLGIVSLFYLEAFDFNRIQVWVWFPAYIAYPIMAAYIAWRQRHRQERADGPIISPLLRGYLLVQGALVTLLALLLLLVPGYMVERWPWAITPMLAQIYSAPFLAFGLGSLMMARQERWKEIRIALYAMLVFTTGVLIASLLHQAIFDFNRPAVWLWFGIFWVITLSLALFSALRVARVVPAPHTG